MNNSRIGRISCPIIFFSLIVASPWFLHVVSSKIKIRIDFCHFNSVNQVYKPFIRNSLESYALFYYLEIIRFNLHLLKICKSC